MKSYDLAIIGSGPGGYVAGLYASRHNLSICVIEKDLVGGTCLNRGCIPTKVMLRSAYILSELRSSVTHGIEVQGVKIDFRKIIARKAEVVGKLRAGIEMLYRANKIDLIKGEASLKSKNIISVSGIELSAKNIIIATGSRPSELPGMMPDGRDIFSSDGILDITEVPRSILIIGGGVIGCEFAAVFNAFGAKVSVVEILDRILMPYSREASKKMESILKKRGVDIFTGTRVDKVERGDTARKRLSNGAVIDSEKVLVAVGRSSNIDGIGLEKAGVKTQLGRIRVDEHLRTNIKNIYAIGDCIGGPLLAHKASYDGILACDNIMGKARRVDYSNIPNCVYTDPEIASVGLNEDEARKKSKDVKVAKFPYLASGKAFLMGKTEGFIKIVGDAKGAILGIEIMGEQACDLIGEAVLAKTLGANIKDLSLAVHGHPTLSEIFQEAAHIFCGTPIHSL